MKTALVRLNIIDKDDEKFLNSYVLVNPDEGKLAELKQTIESRFDRNGLTDEEVEAKEAICDRTWDYIKTFIAENFLVLDIDEDYKISY